MITFKRKIYDKLLEWKNNSKGSSALLIEGARRVGKTTIVKEFAKKEYSSSIIIDFMKPKKGTIELFETYSYDIGLLTSNISLLYQVELKKRDSLIVFDEVQKYPKARELIKYLVEDGRYDYIETGSLISIKENVKNIQIPSEEDYIHMGPMDFEEWLWANDDTMTMDYIRDRFDKMEPLGQVMNRVVMDKFRLYMITGGMPGAVSAYIGDHNLMQSEKVKRQILDLYRNDIHKKEKKPEMTLKVFNAIPEFLSMKKKVFRPGVVNQDSKTDDYSDALEWLSESKIVNICTCNTDPNSAMNLNNNSDRLKAYLLDTGLLITLAFDVGVLDENVFIDLAKSRLNVNEGMIFENMAAQTLVSSGHKLYFSEFYADKSDKNLYEVDFLLVKKNKLTVIEAKSSYSSSHASLDKFINKYGKRIEKVYVVHSKDLRIDGNITYIPLYMASLL